MSADLELALTIHNSAEECSCFWRYQFDERGLRHIAAECVEGLLDFLRGEPEPGGNRSPSYRWGWITGRADRHGADQFDALRHQYARIKIGKAA